MGRPKSIKRIEQRQVRIHPDLAAALEDLAVDLPGHYKAPSLSEMVDMAASEFLLRWRYLEYLTKVRPREERCPECNRMTQVLPIHYPGKLAFYDIGHKDGCKRYMQNAKDAYAFRLERLPLPHSWAPLNVNIKPLWQELGEILEGPDKEKRLKAWMKENFKDGKPTKRAQDVLAKQAKQERERKEAGLRKDWLGIGRSGHDSQTP